MIKGCYEINSGNLIFNVVILLFFQLNPSNYKDIGKNSIEKGNSSCKTCFFSYLYINQ